MMRYRLQQNSATQINHVNRIQTSVLKDYSLVKMEPFSETLITSKSYTGG